MCFNHPAAGETRKLISLLKKEKFVAMASFATESADSASSMSRSASRKLKAMPVRRPNCRIADSNTLHTQSLVWRTVSP
jgi:hypothetical protein